jgi:hypothetical protein
LWYFVIWIRFENNFAWHNYLILFRTFRFDRHTNYKWHNSAARIHVLRTVYKFSIQILSEPDDRSPPFLDRSCPPMLRSCRRNIRSWCVFLVTKVYLIYRLIPAEL